MTTASVVKPETTASEASTLETSVNEHTYTPKVDVWETTDNFNIVVEMPGVNRDGVNVKLEEGVLMIIGRIEPLSFEGYEPAFSEYKIGNFERAFQISEAINAEKIQATLADGVLTLVLPKKESAKPKKIEVEVGQ